MGWATRRRQLPERKGRDGGEAKQSINGCGIHQRQMANPRIIDASLANWRPISLAEHALIMHLLRREFQGRAEILEQVKSLEVLRVCFGCSLKLRSQGPLAEVKDSERSISTAERLRVPVEGFYDDVIDETEGTIRHRSPC